MPLRNDLLNPIRGDNPSGANLRFDPITDKIKEARREDDATAPQGDWKTVLKVAELPVVIKLAGDALANRSKDLQLAVWLVDAHIRREGFPIVAPALRFLREMTEQFWDTLYPPIDEDGDLEVRSAPLSWLGTNLGKPDSTSSLGFLPIVSGKLSWAKYKESRKVGSETEADTYEKQQAREAAINEGKMSAEQFDEAADATPVETLKETFKQIKDAQQALEELTEYCDNQFGDATPSFVKTRDMLDEVAQTVRIILSRRPGGLDEPEEEQEAPPEEEETVSTDSEPESSGFGFDEETSTEEEPAAEEQEEPEEEEEEEPKPKRKGKSKAAARGGAFGEPTSREEAGQQLLSICRFLRNLDPADAAPYLIMRSFAWGPLMANAPALNKSILEAPPTEVRVNLKRFVKEGDWDQVLENTEAAMAQPYGASWLDMQRYTENGITGKGVPTTGTAVNKLLRSLLEMVPDLQEATLPDDTPTANPETINWIENFVTIRKLPPPEKKPEEGSESGDSFGSSDSGDFGSSDSSDTPSDSSFSMDETPSDDTSSMDPSSDMSSETPAEETPEAEPEPEPEPEPYEVEENPPIMEAEEPPPSDSSDEFVQALYAVKDGRTAEGLAMITAILATERSGRARFRRRTQLAHLLMAAGKGKVAHPMLDQLVAEIEQRHLEDWEQSEAIAYPLELLLHCLSPADEERRTELYTRICKLDPVRAVNCSF